MLGGVVTGALPDPAAAACAVVLDTPRMTLSAAPAADPAALTACAPALLSPGAGDWGLSAPASAQATNSARQPKRSGMALHAYGALRKETVRGIEGQVACAIRIGSAANSAACTPMRALSHVAGSRATSCAGGAALPSPMARVRQPFGRLVALRIPFLGGQRALLALSASRGRRALQPTADTLGCNAPGDNNARASGVTYLRARSVPAGPPTAACAQPGAVENKVASRRSQ